MEFAIKYVRDGFIHEDVWNLRAQHHSGSSLIMAAAREILDKTFGPNTVQKTNHTLLRVKSYTKQEEPIKLAPPAKRKAAAPGGRKTKSPPSKAKKVSRKSSRATRSRS